MGCVMRSLDPTFASPARNASDEHSKATVRKGGTPRNDQYYPFFYSHKLLKPGRRMAAP